jgi:peptidoglycan hydrolase-like protein with peptidoglycan-binding domain
MPNALCRKIISGLILAALAAGTWIAPAVGVQTSSSSAPKAARKTSSTSKPTKTSGKISKNRHRGKKVKGQTAPTSDRISAIQEALAGKGTFTGTPTGKWDDSTVEAMKRFQASNGLNPSGKLDALTLQKLGLGSETAGVAAPTPPPNSANRLRSQSPTPVESQAEPRE